MKLDRPQLDRAVRMLGELGHDGATIFVGNRCLRHGNDSAGFLHDADDVEHGKLFVRVSIAKPEPSGDPHTGIGAGCLCSIIYFDVVRAVLFACTFDFLRR